MCWRWNKHLYKFNRHIEGLDNVLFTLGFKSLPTLYLKLNLCFLFSLIPFRLLGLIGFSLYIRAWVGLLSAIVIFVYSRKIVPYVLGTKFFQLFLFYSLCLDEKLKSLYPICGILIVSSLVTSFTYLFIFVEESRFVCLVFLFYWSFYRSLKVNFVNDTSPFCFLTLRKEVSKRNYFTWLDIIGNMSIVCFLLFEVDVINRLNPSFNHRQFKYLMGPLIPR